MDRDGRLIDYRIEEGTGYKILDQEVEAMIERASPVPPPPAEGEKQRYVFRVPVGFYLR